MSDTILSSRWILYYDADNRRKQIKRDTSVTPTVRDSWQTIYEAIADHFDEYNYMDDGQTVDYITNVRYKIGIIDSGDKDPWFIDFESVEYTYGGSLETINWKRVQDTNVGIVRVPRSGTNIVEGDIGNDITHADGDSGTLLDVAGSYLWIRPDSYDSTDNWDSSSGNITCNGHIDTQTAAAETGEIVWANPFSLTPTLIGDDLTHLYIYQDGAKVTSYKGSWNWWDDGHFDVLIPIYEVGATQSSLIDEGYITVFARRYSQKYSYYEVDLSDGIRTPIPLSVGDDVDNDTGTKQVTLGTSSGNWNEGDEIEGKVSGARGVITGTSGSNPTITLYYYLIGDLTDFNGSEGIQNNSDTGDSSSSGSTSAYGPAALSGLSITHGAATDDINEDGTDEYYSITIDCSDERLYDVFEWTKYIDERGSTDTSNNDGINGEAYIGSTYRITYTTITGSIAEGDTVTQVTSGATGVVVAHHTTPKILVLRNTRGTFNDSNNIEKDGGNYVTGPTCVAITPPIAPYGTYAYPKWTCAPGVRLTNVNSADYNNWSTIDDEGVARERPTKVTGTVGNTRAGDHIAIWRLASAGGVIEKDRYTIDSGQGAAGSTTLKVDPDITVDEPGKTTGGVVKVVDVSAGHEDRYRYLTWSGDTFNLFNLSGTADGSGCDQTTLKDTGANFQTNGVQPGDIVYNSTEGSHAYVVTVDSEDQLTTSNTGSDSGVTDWTSDGYVVGGTVRAMTTSDTAYPAIMDVIEDTGTDVSPGSESVQITYDADVPVRIRVRNSGLIKTETQDSTITSSGMAVNARRDPDTVYGT